MSEYDIHWKYTLEALDAEIAADDKLEKTYTRLIVGLCAIFVGGVIGLVGGILTVIARHLG